MPSVLSALSCGAAVPVRDLTILQISFHENDLPVSSLTEDLNTAHRFLSGTNPFLFPSSFDYSEARVDLPALRSLSSDASSEALIGALRGRDIPLSYRTDREAVEWAFTSLLSWTDQMPGAFSDWLSAVRKAAGSGGTPRIVILLDLCDPLSSGSAFSLLRFLRKIPGIDSSDLYLIALAETSCPVSTEETKQFREAVHAINIQEMVCDPGVPGTGMARACWLLGMPASLPSSPDAWKIVYVAAARMIGRLLGEETVPAEGLHTLEIPGILTLQSLGAEASSFASFIHCAAWLLSDLLPSIRSWSEHPGALRSLSPNTRSGLFRRLFHPSDGSAALPAEFTSVQRALKALCAETVSLIRSMPDPLRSPSVSDPLWSETVDACGRVVTVASEYDVSLLESENSGILSVKPVHRVSLADTEEEKLQKRLSDIRKQLEEEIEKRNRLFTSLGAFRARYAVLDCRSRCRDALSLAKTKLEDLLLEEEPDHLSVAAQTRRVQLLEAAVARCNTDLADETLWSSQSGMSLSQDSLSPYDSCILSQKACEKLSSFLSPDGDGEQARKEMRALLPFLFRDPLTSDAKTLMKKLVDTCAGTLSEDPFQSLFNAAAAVSHEETASLRFLSAGNVPSVPLLPDLYPEEPLITFSSLAALLNKENGNGLQTEQDMRGTLACFLLRQYRRRSSDEAVLEISDYRSGDSPILDSWLSSHRTESVTIVSLRKEDDSLPFMIILPGKGFLCAHRGSAHNSMIPAFSRPWWDEESFVFRDPSSLLSCGDLSVLLSQLSSMEKACVSRDSSALHAFLRSFSESLEAQRTSSALPSLLSLRLKSAYGLRLLPAFSSSLVRTVTHYEHSLPVDRIASALTAKAGLSAPDLKIPDDIVFTYRDVPFAREDPQTLLSPIPLPAEDYILSLLDQECRRLEASSDQYHDLLENELRLLLLRNPDASPESREVAESLLHLASRPIREEITELTWPWDPHSPSILTILTESLGASVASSALTPFSDCLTVFPARGNEIIGDMLLSASCQVLPIAPEEEQPDITSLQQDAVLPPFSSVFAESLCMTSEGRTLLRPDLLAFDRPSPGEIRVTMTLEGSFTVRLIRVYREEDILRLYSHDIPTLAVWPDIPFRPENWKAYFIYASFGPDFVMDALYNDGSGASVSSTEDAERHIVRTDVFPVCFTFRRGERTLGAVPNLLPLPETTGKGTATACVDFGSVGTSVVLSFRDHTRPLQGQTMMRTILNNPASSADLLRREFLPSVPLTALLPTASRIFRNTPGAPPQPFEDGIVLMTSGLRDLLSVPSDHLYTCLKWEEEKGRSAVLCLHQIMLMTALQARIEGVDTLRWRFAIPDEMAREGRERLCNHFLTLARAVNESAGYPAPENDPFVFFAPESSSLGAYFRFCASEDTRGGFMVLDLGACTADLSLFLRGREQAVRTCQIPLGIHYLLLPALLQDPDLLLQELLSVQDPSFRQDLSVLSNVLKSARSDSSVLRRARLALDCFLEEYAPLIIPSLMYNPGTGMPTRLGSVLLLHFSFLMMLSGLNLLQIAADPGKNDFLPEQMSLCLAGRGSLLLENLPPEIKTGLWHCLTMFRNPRVASISLLFSSEKKMEIAVGLSILQGVTCDLPVSSSIPTAVGVRPEELLPQFLLRFAREFPASAQILFPDCMTGDFYHPFTPRGESVISASIAQSFTAGNALRPFDALASWITTLLEMINLNG